MTSTFGAALKQFRESRRLSQSKFAERVNCSHSFISRLEGGHREPTRDMVDKICILAHASRDEEHALYHAAGFLLDRYPTFVMPELETLNIWLATAATEDLWTRHVKALITHLATLTTAHPPHH